MCQWPRMMAASPGRAGLGGGQRGDRVDGLAGPFLLAADPAAAHDLDGLGGVREGQPGGHGGDLHDTALVAAVAALAGVMATGTWRQGRAASWAYRPGWLRLTVNR